VAAASPRKRLLALIRQYQQRVAIGADRLRRGLGLENLMEWRQANIEQTGTVGDVRYFFHGIGVAVALPDGSVDFDFGHDGRTDGINPWMLGEFAESAGAIGEGFTDRQVVKGLLQDGVQEGWVHQPFLALQDELFYLMDGTDSVAE
jgi:uncharacterized protein DUF6896